LFTDLSLHTRLWESEADGMSGALARHDAILRDTVAAHEGHVVKGRGDGVHAVFATASDAVRAAIACERALGDEEWQVSEPLRARVGIHTGVAELRDGDYFGSAVNRAARLEGIAHGGQIVCSQATADLARDDLAEGVVLVDLGEHRLRDLTRPERVYQVSAPGLTTDFPPLRSLDAFTTNLAPQRTSFVGREAEVAAVKDALADARLVTLTGVGGVGKTRLAVQVAADVLTDFPDGVWLVELAAVGDADAVPDAVLTTVGLVPQPGLTTTATIAEAFAGRQSLLVLDNCEHVLDAAAELVEALLARPGAQAKVLATSREGLRVTDERLWAVPSLGGRDGGGTEAMTLFVERARAVESGFSLDTPEATDAVEEICRRLDGIPLAIELAAARTIAMSAPELRDRLDDRFRLLAGSRRGLERHQTLRHAVQWSYDLLDDDERQLLNRCSVFAGGFDLHAATAIASDGDDDFAVLDVLEALVRKSLVDVDHLSRYTRYRLLETIRQFAEEQLAGTGGLAAVRELHARYYARRAAEVLSWWTDGPRQHEMYAWFKTELANLRAAVHAAVDGGDLDSAATIVVSTAVLSVGTEQFEAATWAEELLDAAQAVDHPQLAALYAAASLCAAGGRAEDGLRYADRARVLFDDAKYVRVPFGGAGDFLAYPYLFSGRPDDWLAFCRAEADRAVDDPLNPSTTLVLALWFAQRHDEATALAPDVVEAAEASGNPTVLNAALTAFQYAYFDRDPTAALGALRRSVEITQDLGISAGHTAAMLARAEAAHGDAGAALVACHRALLAYKASGDLAGARTPLAVLAGLLNRIGRHEAAAVLAGTADYAGMSSYPDLVATIEDIRESVGAERFDALSARGRAMENAAIFRYALEQLDEARADFDDLVDRA
jgi:predicted ATPase/class 3 adenylate cyclase